ncbi:MAG: glycosyltransferase, partial [Krumholzibacteria bacterium]|nr:glycosyltransferase [Candidatus Krumholzibacteria bacterium]
MKLAIVIVHYNTSGDLARCLESLAANPPAAEHRVVVVDNASQDHGLAEVQRRFTDCTWICNSENTGYARGGNLGIAAVEAEYYLVLNPDVVALPGALDALLAFADRNPRAGVVGPQLLNDDGSIQDSCRRFYTFRTLLLRRTILGRLFPDSATVRRHLMKDFDHRSARPVDWILGGCLLARREAVARTGPMDERFFLYFEDVDWCYRMWQAGFEVVYTPEARFIHRHRRDSARGRFNRSFFLHLASLISFYEKWGMVVWLLKKWREPLLLLLLWLLDLAGLAAAFGLAYGLRALMGARFPEPLYPFAEYRPLLLFALVLATVTFLLAGRYRSGRLRGRRSLGEHLQQVGVLAVLLLAATYLGHLDVISRAVLLMFIPLLTVLTALGDRLVDAGRRRLERGHLSLERTLLVGGPGVLNPWLARAGDLAAQGVDVAGYLADPPEAGALPPLAGGVPWL